MTVVAAMKFPPIRITKIDPGVIGGWYGVLVDFEWASPFDVEDYKRAVWTEGNAWFDANPGKSYSGPWLLEEKLQRHIARQIMSASKYSQFFEQDHYLTVRRDDGEGRRVRVPKFMSLRDWSDWNITSEGGSVMATTR
jgi:hypothetical protein